MSEIKTVSIDDLEQELSEETEVYHTFVRDSILEYIRQIEEVDDKTINPERMEPNDANWIKQVFLYEYEGWSDNAIETFENESDYLTNPYGLVDDEHFHLAICRARRNGATLDDLAFTTGIPRKDLLHILRESYYFHS